MRINLYVSKYAAPWECDNWASGKFDFTFSDKAKAVDYMLELFHGDGVFCHTLPNEINLYVRSDLFRTQRFARFAKIHGVKIARVGKPASRRNVSALFETVRSETETTVKLKRKGARKIIFVDYVAKLILALYFQADSPKIAIDFNEKMIVIDNDQL